MWDKDGKPSSWSEPGFWSMGILDPAEWKGQWISYTKPYPAGDKTRETTAPPGKPWAQEAPRPIFRKTFRLKSPAKRAMATICGLGYHELRLNGKKVGDRVLDPVFTRYDKRVLYATYDLGQLSQADNAIEVQLGNGFYNPHAKDVWHFEKSPWRARPRLLMQLRLEYADGTVETIATDGTWQAATGPLLFDGIRNGEV